MCAADSASNLWTFNGGLRSISLSDIVTAMSIYIKSRVTALRLIIQQSSDELYETQSTLD